MSKESFPFTDLESLSIKQSATEQLFEGQEVNSDNDGEYICLPIVDERLGPEDTQEIYLVYISSK